MARSVFLRGYDEELAEMVVGHMESLGTQFYRNTVPIRLERLESGRIRAFYRQGTKESEADFDTVMVATGRVPSTVGLGLDTIGIRMTGDGKILTEKERTSVPHIYAVGDILHGKPELTPVAIQAGRFLARRLFSDSTSFVDYSLVPTCVYTPLEYSCCGMTEAEAYEAHGKENVDVRSDLELSSRI